VKGRKGPDAGRVEKTDLGGEEEKGQWEDTPKKNRGPPASPQITTPQGGRKERFRRWKKRRKKKNCSQGEGDGVSGKTDNPAKGTNIGLGLCGGAR